MFNVDTTKLIAIMLAAGSLFLAALLAARVIGLARQVSASNFPIHVTASAFHIGAQVTIRTFLHVTRRLTCVWITCMIKCK